MREEKVPLSLARDQMLGVETSLECCARKACKGYCARARRMAGDDYSERGDAFLD